MIRAEYAFDLPVPPKEAFAILSDPAMDVEWQSSCVHAKLLDGEPRPGSRYEIVFQMIGKRLEFLVEVDEFEPGVRSKFHTLDGPFGYVGTYEYTERPDGTTRVQWTFDVDPGDYFGIMPKPLLRKVLVTQVKKDSGRLAARLAEEARLSA
ncbi:MULTISPECIES: SRPBCC family protein [unclassified Streptomyces]|uniref:SRPBCC family protein n=1 Tax=unclassified Streptomyces TaxID=2593676 RepID=UPI00278BE46A|nr:MULTISPECIES: SRPBCC family protein [unclassified Streptomyces]